MMLRGSMRSLRWFARVTFQPLRKLTSAPGEHAMGDSMLASCLPCCFGRPDTQSDPIMDAQARRRAADAAAARAASQPTQQRPKKPSAPAPRMGQQGGYANDGMRWGGGD